MPGILGRGFDLTRDPFVGRNHCVACSAQLLELLCLAGDDLGHIVNRAGSVGKLDTERTSLFSNFLSKAGVSLGRRALRFYYQRGFHRFHQQNLGDYGLSRGKIRNHIGGLSDSVALSAASLRVAPAAI
ncbi:MAG: hypothetical protein R3D05_21670 [Dongiaceae bacterium]